jgi:hypothetical protein
MSNDYEKRKLRDEMSYSWRSMSIRSFCNRRSELYYKALKTGSKLDWGKYEDLSAKFVRLHGPKKRR